MAGIFHTEVKDADYESVIITVRVPRSRIRAAQVMVSNHKKVYRSMGAFWRDVIYHGLERMAQMDAEAAEVAGIDVVESVADRTRKFLCETLRLVYSTPDKDIRKKLLHEKAVSAGKIEDNYFRIQVLNRLRECYKENFRKEPLW